jgi:hypothetical protein
MESMMTTKPTTWAEVNAQGDLVIPRDLVEQFGLMPGARAWKATLTILISEGATTC